MPKRLRPVALALLALVLPARAGTNEWTSLGLAGVTVECLGVSPGDRDLIYAGYMAGFAKSTDRGATWTKREAQFTPYAVAFDPRDPERVFAATSSGLGLTTDGGSTWVGLIAAYLSAVTFDPKDPNVVYAGGRYGVWKSVDRGSTWADSSTGLPSHSIVLALAVHPVQNDVIYAALWGGIYKSTNGGATWSATGAVSGRIRTIAVDPVNPDLVVATASNSVGLARSTDGGAHWTNVAGSVFANVVVADRAVPGTFYAGAGSFLVSQDGGATWTSLSAGLSGASIRSLAVDPSERTRLYAGTESAGSSPGGVYAIDLSSGSLPSLRVTSPNGGEVWKAGSSRTITWTSTGGVARVKVEYSTGGSWGSVFSTVAADVPNTGSYAWTVPQHLSSNCYVRVSDVAGTCSDTSDAAFTITTCSGVSIFPWDASYPAAGGSGTITVATQVGCPWTANSNVPWVTVTSGSSGSGSGGVSYTVAPNTGPARSGTLSIGERTFTVKQAEGTPPAGEVVLFVPIVLDVQGAHGSHFTSELTLTNRGGTDATVRLSYTGSADLGGGSGTATLTLPARRQRILGDAIAELKALGVPIPGSGNRGGTLTVGFSGLSSEDNVGVTVRTTTAVPNGRAGLAYAGVPAAKRMTGSALICGLRETALDRSNVALQNAGTAADGDVTLRVTVRSGDTGASAVLPDVTLPPGGFRQIGGVLATAGASNGWVRVERVAGNAPYTAYGVVNDNANSDGSFVPAQEETGTGASGLTVPVVVEASVYSSELVLTNVSGEDRDVTLTLVADAVATPTHETTITVPVAAERQVVLPNVIDAFRTRGAPGVGAGSGFAGALFLTPVGGSLQGFVAGVRTSAPGGGGRYGLFYPAVPFGGASTRSAWLYGLRQDAENRTNVALVNTGEGGWGEDVFAFDLWDGDTGQLVHSEEGVKLGYRRWLQVNSALSAWASGVSQGYVEVRHVAGNSAFVAYAVVNDGGVPQQRSDDGAFVASSE